VRVLIIDDDEDLRTLLTHYIKGRWVEAQVDEFDPIEQDFPDEKFPLGDYDVVILDQAMPGITGLSLARELSAARPGLPVVLYTGNSEHLRREDLAAAGVRAVLAKPVEPDQLHGLLRSLLP